jgi:hypothetical protein
MARKLKELSTHVLENEIDFETTLRRKRETAKQVVFPF